MPVPVAGLDLSLQSSGVAVIDAEGKSHMATFKEEIPAKASDRDKIERIIRIASRVMEMLRKHDVKYIGIENYAFTKHGLTRLAELNGAIKVQAYLGLKTVPVSISVQMIRKHLLGKYVKDKTVVRDHLIGLGHTPDGLDESDALAVAVLMNDWANNRSKIVDVSRMEAMSWIDNQIYRTPKKQKKRLLKTATP